MFFEEWDDPLISGIQWVEELIEIAGGDPVFPELRHAKLGKDRIVSPERVIAAAPDVIIGSWCGKPVRKERIAAREGWDVDPGRPERSDPRSEIDLYPAARPCRADRRRTSCTKSFVSSRRTWAVYYPPALHARTCPTAAAQKQWL